MARSLIFKINGKELAVIPTKVDRRKLYGWTELLVIDSNNKQCRQAAINADGVTIVDQGATKTGIISEDGCWINREELVAMKEDGSVVSPVESSFDSGCVLDQIADIEEVLDTSISSVYQLGGEDAVELLSVIGDNIYKFQFTYRTGYSSGIAFLLANPIGVFILTGNQTNIEYVGLEETGVIDDCEDAEMEEELDFSMM